MCYYHQAEEFDRVRTEFERNQEKQLSLMDQFHPTMIQNNLKVAILEADEESEKVVEEFLQSKYYKSLNAFLSLFSNKLLVIRSGIHDMPVRITNR